MNAFMPPITAVPPPTARTTFIMKPETMLCEKKMSDMPSITMQKRPLPRMNP